jgi:phosphocarrier protein HPr
MLREPIVIQNTLGLHTRAAAKLVATASKFESKIEFIRNDQMADCKSIMSIILLGAKKGTQMDLIITGSDELEARDAILSLIANKFEEAS